MGKPWTIDENTVHDGVGGAPLGLIKVTDPDADDPTTHQEGADRVTLTGDHADYFQVILDPENGLWLAMAADATFDFETVGGSVMVTVTYTDGDGEAASMEVTVTVNDVNEVAEVEGEVANAVFEGGQMNEMEIDLKALFSDPDGDGLNYRLSDNAPDWLEFSTTIKGTGEDQTITGRLYGTPPDSDITADDVSIIASDGGGLEAHAMFDVVVDAENAAPNVLELRVTDDEGVTTRVTAVEVDENATGEVLGNVVLRDPDDARHPHGQHEYSFMVDGAADDRFEVTDDGHLKLKDDASLNHEAGSEIKLIVTATDMHVHEPEEGEDGTTESISLEITITVGDVDTGDTEGPAVVADAEVEDVTVTVNEDLDEDDVDEGDWLDETPGGLADAFEDEDGNSAEVSIVIAVAISDSGDEDEANPMGVVTVKVTATDKGGKKTEGYITFQLTDVGGDNEATDDPQYEEPATGSVGSGGIMKAGANADDDAPGTPPGDGGLFIDDAHVLDIETDDLLDSFVLAIDDIDIA